MLLTDLIDDRARSIPGSDVLIFRDEVTSASALQAEVQTAALALARQGIGVGDRVALLLPNCPAFLWFYFGAARIGAAAVPANPVLKPAELQYMWRDADVRLVVTVGTLAANSLAAAAEVASIQRIICVGDPPADVTSPLLLSLDDAKLGDEQTLPPASNEGDCAVIIYTSGTTGRPKGAMLSHRNLVRNVQQVCAAIPFSPTDRFLTVLPLFHSFAATVCMNTALGCGGSIVLLEGFHPTRTLEAIERHRSTVFCAVPAILQALLHFPADRDYDLSSLRAFVSGGAPLPASTLEAIEAKFGVPVLEGDGPTECSPVTSVNRLEGPRKIRSVGPPLPGVAIAILDEKNQHVATGEVGEICVRGDNVMLGYLNLPEATAEAMAGDWYHTGDLGRLDEEGYLYIVDRKKDMLLVGGLNVYPREVEDVLMAHPAVMEVAVVGLPDSLRGDEVTAVVVVRPGEEISRRTLVSWCRERLANYKTPRRVIFRHELPRGATGKVVKRLLLKELELESVQGDLTED